MKPRITAGSLGLLIQVTVLIVVLAVPVLASAKKWAVVIRSGSKQLDVSLADMSKFCRG